MASGKKRVWVEVWFWLAAVLCDSGGVAAVAASPGRPGHSRAVWSMPDTQTSDLSLNYSYLWKRLFSGDLFARELRRSCLDACQVDIAGCKKNTRLFSVFFLDSVIER